MKSILIAGFLGLGIASAAAADFPVKATPYAPAASPIYDWTGFYLGLNGGGGWDHNCWDMNGALLQGFNPSRPEGCNNASGGVVGGQVGYRHMLGNFVFGIEAMGDWADLTGSNRSAIFNGLKLPTNVSLGLTNSTKVGAFGTFTGQIGYAFGGNFLWFVKGGAAVTDNEYNGALDFSATGQRQNFSLTATDHAKEIKFGGVVGTGFEFMFAPGWSVGAEYNHLFMGSRDVGFALTSLATSPTTTIPGNLLKPGMPTRNDGISSDVDVAMVRLNYRFH